jgi:hypothetical protein
MSAPNTIPRTKTTVAEITTANELACERCRDSADDNEPQRRLERPPSSAESPEQLLCLNVKHPPG